VLKIGRDLAERFLIYAPSICGASQLKGKRSDWRRPEVSPRIEVVHLHPHLSGSFVLA
jgi:hypothetical protein